MARTKLNYKKVDYPFYRTNRGIFDTSNAGFTPAMMAEGRQDAMLAFIYFQLRDCAKRANMPFVDTLDQFIDESDEQIFEVFTRLNEAAAAERSKAEKEVVREAE